MDFSATGKGSMTAAESAEEKEMSKKLVDLIIDQVKIEP